MGMEKLWSPCFFGITLQQGVQLIAAVNMAIGVWAVIVAVLYFIMIGEIMGESSTMLLVVGIILAIILLVDVALHYGLLLRGANERSAKKIKIYLIVVLVLVALRFISYLVLNFAFATIFIFILSQIPLAYQLWVVFCFHKEISNVDQYNGQPGGGGGGDQYGEP